MTMMKVRRGTKGRDLVLRGRSLPRGETFDTHDFPHLNEEKWLQLQRLGFVELVEVPGRDSIGRQAVAVERARAHITGDDPDGFVATLTDDAHPCPSCDFVAKNKHGLKIHAGRRHSLKE